MAEQGIDAIEAVLAEYPALQWHRCPDGRGCHGSPGIPDFVIAGARGVLYREVKPHAGEHPRGGQVAWKYALLAVGADWGVWIPADVDSGRVRRELEQLLEQAR